MRCQVDDVEAIQDLFEEAFLGVWRGDLEDNGLNALVLLARLDTRAADDRPGDRQVPAAGGDPVQRRLHRADAGRASGDRRADGRSCSASDSIRRVNEAERGGERASAIERAIDGVASLDEDRILRAFLSVIQAVLRTNHYTRDPATGSPQAATCQLQARPGDDPDPAAAAAEVRDLRLLAAGRGRAPARRQRRPRRAALVGPARGLPHRGPRPDEGPDGQERADRAGRLEGRLRRQAPPDDRRPRGAPGRGDRVLQDVPRAACST